MFRRILNPCRGIVLLLAVIFTAGSARAQVGSGSFYGRVTDPSGAVVAGATLTILNQGTGARTQLKTDAEGNFVSTPLAIGKYTAQAAAPGFNAAELKDILLEIGDRRDLNFTLQIQGTSSTVRVSEAASSPLLESTVSSLGQVIHEQNIVQLPLNGRNFVQLGTLAPGAIASQGTQFNNPSASTSVRGATSLSVSGMRENANDWRIDGIDDNELTAGSISILPSPDAIQEFKVLTNNYSAQYGRSGGGTILLTTKSGTNSYHGAAFEFLRNDIFDAKTFFDPKKPAFRQNQFGGAFGGPIKKNKIFFFGDYQGLRIRKGITAISTVPTALARQGIFTEAGQPTIFNPCTTYNAASHTCTTFNAGARVAFAGNTIPANMLDPIAVQILNFYPIPTSPGVSNNFIFTAERRLNQDEGDVRIDANISSKDTLYGRFSIDNSYQFFPGPLPGLGGGTSSFVSSTINIPRARNIAVVWNHIFSPSLVNQAVAGFNRIFISVVGPSYGTGNLSQQLGIPGANQGDKFTSGLTRFDLTGFNGIGDRLTTPLLLGSNVYQYSDNVSWVHSRHSFNFGFATLFNQLNGTAYNAPRGDMAFSALFTAQNNAGAFQGGTGSAVASLLLGLPASEFRTNVFGGDVTGRRWVDFRTYFQDDWRISPKLTLNLGLAYMFITAPTEAGGRFSNVDLATQTLLVAGVNASDTGNVQTHYLNLQPRIGFAYTPFQNAGLVIRGGYGIFNDWAQGGMNGLQVNPPFVGTPTFTSDSINPARILSQGFPAPTVIDPAHPSGSVEFWQNNFQLGRVQQWNFGIQKEMPGHMVATIAYAGAKAEHLLDKNANFNAPPPGPGSINARRPYPVFASINYDNSRAWSIYHSLQAKLEKRFATGLYFLLGYTYSKGLGNEPSENLTFQGSAAGADYFPFAPFGINTDKGLNDNDLRHSFTASYLYELPLGRNRRYASNAGAVLDKFIGGWQLSGITRIRSGYPLGATMSTSLLNNTMANRPNITCDPNSSAPRTVQKWFNVGCFAAPAAFQWGNSSRTFGSGPDQVNFDFAMDKTFSLTETLNLQFRTEMFNIFNHAQFDLPNTAIGTGSSGTITATINDGRVIQFGLKLVF